MVPYQLLADIRGFFCGNFPYFSKYFTVQSFEVSKIFLCTFFRIELIKSGSKHIDYWMSQTNIYSIIQINVEL